METLVVQDWEAEAQDLLSKFEKETGGEHWRSGIKPEDHQSGKAILKADPKLQFAVILIILADKSIGYSGARAAVLMPLLRRDLPYTAEPLERILSAAIDKGEYYGHWSLMLKVAQRYAKKSALTPGLRHRLQQMHDGCRNYGVEGRKFKAQIAELLGVPSLPDAGTTWADAALVEIAGMDTEVQAAWSALFAHVGTAESGKPSAKWLASGETHRAVIGTDDFTRRVTDWMNKVSPPPPLEVTAPKYPTGDDLVADPGAIVKYHDASQAYYAQVNEYLGRISEKNIAILKGLAWYAADIASADLARGIGANDGGRFPQYPRARGVGFTRGQRRNLGTRADAERRGSRSAGTIADETAGPGCAEAHRGKHRNGGSKIRDDRGRVGRHRRADRRAGCCRHTPRDIRRGRRGDADAQCKKCENEPAVVRSGREAAQGRARRRQGELRRRSQSTQSR